MSTTYVVHTPTGYVGRYTLSDELSADMPAGLAYTYSAAEALAIATRFHGTVVPSSRVRSLPGADALEAAGLDTRTKATPGPYTWDDVANAHQNGGQ